VCAPRPALSSLAPPLISVRAHVQFGPHAHGVALLLLLEGTKKWYLAPPARTQANSNKLFLRWRDHLHCSAAAR
jgi:hypothetical protein